VQMTGACLAALTSSLFLVYTGVTRFASATLDEQMEKTRAGSVDRDLSHLLTLTGQAVDVLEGGDPERMLKEFGAMLHEGWETKKRLSSKVSNPSIDAMYEAACATGALGGKLCGAGSGGFLLMLVPPEHQAGFHARFAEAGVIRVNVDTIGSAILSN
jgi:D-glycero-alpha-D-manno-heptose-7-phosphate kinase